MPLLLLLALCATLLGTPDAASAQPRVVVGVGAVWPGPVYPPPYGPYYYPYGGIYAPWGPCASGFCGYGVDVRSAIRREFQQQELRRELEQRANEVSSGGAASPYAAPRYVPAPTPESQLQPRYRGSGEVRPEYRDSGKAR